jgi:hypothetical protein
MNRDARDRRAPIVQALREIAADCGHQSEAAT